MPFLEAVMEQVIPKKATVTITKWYQSIYFLHIDNISSQDRISLITVDSSHLFFQSFDGPYLPTLKLLHQCTM